MALTVETREVPFVAPPPAKHPKKALQQMSYRLRVLDLVLDALGPAEGRTYADLGAGFLYFSSRAQRHGFAVTAVDARPPWGGKEVPEGIDFVRHDVRTMPLEGFDVVAIVGLLYHLRLGEQIDLLKRCDRRPTIIDTEVWCPDLVAEMGLETPRLRPAAPEAGYTGAVLDETRSLWSSHGNPHSFWLDEPSILRLFEACGWSRVKMMDPPYFSEFGRRRWYLLT